MLNQLRFFRVAGQSKWQVLARVFKIKLKKKDAFLSSMANSALIFKMCPITRSRRRDRSHILVSFLFACRAVFSALTRNGVGINVPLLFNISGPFGAPSVA